MGSGGAAPAIGDCPQGRFPTSLQRWTHHLPRRRLVGLDDAQICKCFPPAGRAGAHGQTQGAPLWQVHRADLQKILYEKAKELGVIFTFGAPVVSVDCERATVTLKSGETLQSDLVRAVYFLHRQCRDASQKVIGADGLHGMSRSCMLGRSDPPKPTGDLAYRV